MGVKVHQTLKFHIDNTLKLAQWKIVTGCHGVFTIFNSQLQYNYGNSISLTQAVDSLLKM